MKYFQISLLFSFILFLAVVHAQDFYESEDFENNARFRRDARDFVFQENDEEVNEQLRYRRHGEDENARHRRQGHGGGGHEGVTGPVHTFVKTDEHAHFKWGVRHHVGHEYAGRR